MKAPSHLLLPFLILTASSLSLGDKEAYASWSGRGSLQGDNAPAGSDNDDEARTLDGATTGVGLAAPLTEGDCSSLSFRILPRVDAGSTTVPTFSDAGLPDPSIHYSISTEDVPSSLSDSTLDDIVEITLHGKVPINLAEVEISLTQDRDSWIKTDIVEHGVWEVGSSITIRERGLDDARSGNYLVVVSTAKGGMPIAECIFNTDNDPDRIYDFLSMGSRSEQCGSDLPDHNGSKCWQSRRVLGIGPEYLVGAAALGLEYYGCEWNSHFQKWQYAFRLAGVFTGGTDVYQGYIRRITLDFEATPGIIGHGFPETGAWHLDEDSPVNWDLIAQFACSQAIGYLSPIAGFALDFMELAAALQVREEPDLEWYAPFNTYQDASCFTFYELSVPPDTAWQLEIDLSADYTEDGTEYTSTISLSHDDPFWGSHGDGKIIFSDTSPAEPTEGDLIARDVWISSQAEDWDKHYVVEAPVAGQEVWSHFEYDWTGSETCPTHHVELRRNGNIQCQGDVTDVPEWSRVTICCSSPWTAVAGPSTLVGETDTWSQVDEVNENNNDLDRYFVVPIADTTPPETWITYGPSGTIDYNSVTFTWTGDDDITQHDEIEYSYILEGYEASWSSWASVTGLTYSDLPDASYTFRVKARDEAQNEDLTPANSSFIVAVPTMLVVKPDGSGDYPTIQAAINAASEGMHVVLTDGTFQGSGNRDIDYLSKAITVRSQSGNPELCIIDCQGSALTPRRGLYLHSGEGLGSVLEGITIANGYEVGEDIAGSGGAVLCYNASATIRNCIMRDNTADGWPGFGGGGAICCWDANPTISHCVFLRNAAGLDGGAICGTSTAFPTIFECEFRENQALSGGALAVNGSSSVIARKCLFEDNQADGGGAVSIWSTWNRPAELIGCVFAGNRAVTEGGGAVYAAGYQEPVLIDSCLFAGNVVQASGHPYYDGGGIYANAGRIEVRASTFVDNHGNNGGGVYLFGVAKIVLERVVIASSTQGAAVYSFYAPPDTTVITCCDFYGNAGGDWDGWIADQYGVNGNISADPLFCDPANGDYHLFNTSPCAPDQQPECGLIGALGIGCAQQHFTVRPNGTGDYPTIQAAINAASSNAIIELTDGIFTGTGNRDIDFLGKAITVRSQSRNPDACIIDCQGSQGTPYRGFYFHAGEGSGSVLQGVAIRNGYARNGAGIYFYLSSPTISDCILFENVSWLYGGAMSLEHEASPTITGCTLWGNAATSGGAGLDCYDNSSPILSNTIIASSTHGPAAYCQTGSSPTLSCCDVHGNAGGDWVGCIQGQYGVNGNISLDPFLCSPEHGDFHIMSSSPCAPEHAPPGCGQIGALDVGCESSGVEEAETLEPTFYLARCAPNPMSSSTTITYGIPNGGAGAIVSLRIYDVGGRLVRTLVEQEGSPGHNRVDWDGADNAGRSVASGIYYYRLVLDGQERTDRVVLLR